METTLTITVGKGLEWDYTTIQQALDAVPYRTKATIQIQPGTYREKLFSDKRDVTLVGSGADRTVIVFGDAGKTMLGEGRKRGTFRSWSAFFSGETLHLSQLSIVNDAGYGPDIGQALALYLDVREAYLDHVELRAHQDTLFLAPLPEKEREAGGFYGPRMLCPREMTTTVVTDSVVEGNVDFIFGGGDALFAHCKIVSNGEGYVTAPSGYKHDRGLVFDDCDFVSGGAKDGSVYLMRPWRSEGKSTFIRCRYGSHIHPEGFSRWHDRQDPCTFAEFDVASSGPMIRSTPAVTLTEAQANTLVSSFRR